MSQKIIKILVVDDHYLIVDGIKSMLQDEADMEFAGSANSMNQALEFIEQNRVDVVLMDINMPDGSGIETTVKIKARHPGIFVLALTMHEDISIISKMMEAGASGYILKRTTRDEVLEAIKVVADNKKYLARDVQSIMIDNLSDSSSEKPVLTKRENEILNLIAREFRNEDIANLLFISERTVETHRRNILTKTKTKNIVGLMKYAMEKGLIDFEPARLNSLK